MKFEPLTMFFWSNLVSATLKNHFRDKFHVNFLCDFFDKKMAVKLAFFLPKREDFLKMYGPNKR